MDRTAYKPVCQLCRREWKTRPEMKMCPDCRRWFCPPSASRRCTAWQHGNRHCAECVNALSEFLKDDDLLLKKMTQL